MATARQPEWEERRVSALEQFRVLDTPREPAFDEVAALAAEICETPIAVVNLIGMDRQFFKAEVGLGVRETPLDSSFCAKAILEDEFLLVPDATRDPRFECNPLVTGEAHLRFYAGALLKTAEGLPIGTLCVLDRQPRDLTRLQQHTLKVLAHQVMTQLELRRALLRRDEDEARNRAILDSATDFAIIATDLGGRVTRWNAGAERILGWSEADILGDTFDRIFTPADQADGRARHEMEQALKTGHGNDERWHRRKSGELFWAQGQMTPLRSGSGATTGFVKVLRDRTAERLREERLRLLAEASAALLSASDPDSVTDSILKAGTEILGIDKSYYYMVTPDGAHLQLVNSIGVPDTEKEQLQFAPFSGPLCGIIAERHQPLLLTNFQSTIDERYEAGRRSGIEAFAGFPIVSPSKLHGVISFVSLTEPTFDAETIAFFATLARFLSISRERLEREAALSDLAMTLEQRIEERTRELMASEEALRHSQKLDAVGQLTGGVAHDFNNLLTVIRGSADLLRRDKLTPERRTRYVEAISETAERAAKLTGQLLAFARRQTLKPEVFDVELRLNSIIEMLDTVTGSHVRVVTDFPERRCLVRADASQFETAIVNMAVNARDAMNGEGTLTIALRAGQSKPVIRGHAAAPGPFVTVALTDTGSGISAEHLSRIFDPFFTTKDVGKGTGLGLSQVFGFVKQSGGDIEVESTPGHGTTMTIYLPEAEADVQADPSRDEAASLGEMTGLRVLVVEDNLDVGQFSVQALTDYGYDAVLVNSAEEALQLLTADAARFDIVFSDVVMPGMGGLDLARALARSHPHIPVILASGYSHILAQEGSHGFELLSKPYSADQLSGAIQRVVRQPRRRG